MHRDNLKTMKRAKKPVINKIIRLHKYKKIKEKY